MAPSELKLPADIIGQVDVVRALRELNNLNDFFVNAAARTGGTPIQPPRLSRALDELAKENKYNLLEQAHRVELAQKLNVVLKKAPLVHISFAAEPSPKALERILVWMRQNIHPQTLLQVGLQPTIAAGAVLRTPNKWFDMSMREHLKKQIPYLIQLIHGASSGR